MTESRSPPVLGPEGAGRMQLLSDAAALLLGTLRTDELLPRVLDVARRLLRADAYAVWRKESADAPWRIAAAHGLSARYVEDTTRRLIAGVKLPAEPVVIEEPDRDPTVASHRDLQRAEGIESLLVVPLRVHGETTGTVVFYSRSRHRFAPEDVEAARALGTLAGVAISNADLYARLAESESRYRFLAEHAGDMLVRVNAAGRYVDVSPASLRVLGYAPDELVGQLARDLLHPEDLAGLSSLGRDSLEGRLHLLRFRHRDGHYLTLEVSVILVRDAEGSLVEFVAALRDVTPRVVAESRLRVLYALADRVGRARQLDDVYAAALDSIAQALGAPRSSILLFDRDGVMRFKASAGLSEEYRRAVEGHTPWTMGDAEAQPILVPDVQADPALASYLPVFAREGIRSLGFIPLNHEGRVIGKFMIYHAAPHAFTPDEVGLARVIAGHVAAAIARSQNERQLRIQARVLESMVEGVSLADFQGIIVYTNAAHDRMFGYEREGLLGKHVTALNAYTPEENERIVAHVFAQLGTQGQWEGEWENRRKDGASFLTRATITALEVEGKPHYICVQEDITQQRRAERALQQSEERFRVLADTLPQMAWYARPDGRIDWANRAWTDYTGQSEHEVKGEGWFSVVHPDDLARAKAAWLRGTERLEPYDVVFRLRRAGDGAHRWHLGRASPIRDEAGGVVRWFGTCTDIHDQKTSEEALVRLRAELGESEKMAALGQLVSGVAHELRTPLTFLSNYAFLLRSQLERAARDGVAAKDALRQADTSFEQIEAGVERINQLVEDLRRYTRARGRDDLQREPLAPSVGEAVELFRAAHRSSQPIVADLAPTPSVPINRGAVQQVVLNLLTNALEASPPSASVRVRTYGRDGAAVVEVEDEGAGIAPDVMAKMYEPLFTTKETGTGLGLSIVKRIADEHRATVECESEPGRGARFRLVFSP